jgi:L-fuculose-phosphate aldolase
MKGVDQARHEVHEAACRLVRDGLVVGSAGNISARVDAHHVVVTAGGVPYDKLEAADHPVVDVRDGSWEGPRKPTSELPLHLGVMASMPGVHAIVHTHSRHAAAFAVARIDLSFIMNENMGPAAEHVFVTPYAMPGTNELATAALATFARQPGSRACLLANHGVVAIGPDVDAAYLIAAQVEWIAEVSYLARTLGHQEVLPRAVQDGIGGNYGITISHEEDGR